MTSVAELRKKLLPDGKPHPEADWASLVEALDRDLLDIKVSIQYPLQMLKCWADLSPMNTMNYTMKRVLNPYGFGHDHGY